jgi:Concanavalin A-like lectin/glucanases superfamily
MLLKLAASLLFFVPLFGQYTQSAAVNLPPYAQGLTDFPYLVSCNSTVAACPQFKTVGNGGQVQNSSGFDIAFYADSGCSTTKLNWEIEDWSGTTGNGDWWVQIPASTNTFYECWDNTSISTDQSSKTATWSGENYQLVMHGGSPATFSAADSSANNLSSTVTSVSAGTGIVNGAGSYNGSSSLVDFSTPSATQCTPTCTLEAWVKTSSNPSEQDIISNQWNFCCNGLILSQKSSPVTGLNAAWGKSGSDAQGAALFNLADGNWHFVALVYNAGTGNFYVDGVLTMSTLSTLTTITYAGSGHLIIGRDSNGSDNFFDGLIDEVRISSDAKTGTWEQAIYQNVYNATHTVQPVRAQSLLLTSGYYGGSSCQGNGMSVAQSVDGVHWNVVFNTVETDMTVPVLMAWQGYLWRIHSPTSSCTSTAIGYTIDKTPLPLTPSSTFTSVGTVSPSLPSATNQTAANWFIGDDGIPNILFAAGGGTSTQAIYLITPTDTTGLTTWNTAATALTGTNYIDPQLIELSPTSFVLLAKDETADHIVYFTASSKTGTYTLINSNLFSSGEAPCAIETSPGTWTIYIDNPGSNLQYATTSSFPTGWSGTTSYQISGCNSSGPTNYCFHPRMITVQGLNGVQ